MRRFCARDPLLRLIPYNGVASPSILPSADRSVGGVRRRTTLLFGVLVRVQRVRLISGIPFEIFFFTRRYAIAVFRRVKKKNLFGLLVFFFFLSIRFSCASL